MTELDQPGEQDIERGAAEEESGSPLTPTEAAVSERPPSRPADGSAGDSSVVSDPSGMAGGASGGSGGGSNLPGHPDHE